MVARITSPFMTGAGYAPAILSPYTDHKPNHQLFRTIRSMIEKRVPLVRLVIAAQVHSQFEFGCEIVPV